ncbi:hypothetical protein GF325_00800 [Candidatus Bathyarchaeota archaeon]|nr:hypothetical protein [Candidatus Bathyarchaeota archaeon]
MIIEGPKAKIMIAPLSSMPNNSTSKTPFPKNEYFIALTTLAHVNLGSMFLKTKNTLDSINLLIARSNKTFKPPLREFNEKQISMILGNFNSKNENRNMINILQHTLGLNAGIYSKCEEILQKFKKIAPNLIYSSIAFKGGFILNSIQPSPDFNLTPDNETAMSFSLYDTASRYAWLLKKMNINSIFMNCNHYMHFIRGFDEGIFSSYFYSNNQRIGYIRLLLPRYLSLIQKILKQALEPAYNLNSAMQESFNPLIIR